MKILKKWRLAIETGIVVIALIAIKWLAEHFGLEFISLNVLFTSIIAGGIFLFGLILAGTLADYKESEKMPAELVASCESIYQEALYVKQTRPEFNLRFLTDTLMEVVTGFRADVADGRSRQALSALKNLSESYLEMEELGVPPNYIVRLKTEESSIRRNVLRMYYIMRIDFLPSAYTLVQSTVGLILFLLVVTKIEPFYDAVAILVFLTYLLVYILKLLRTLSKPFRTGERTMDDVSLFLIREFEERITKSVGGTERQKQGLGRS